MSKSFSTDLYVIYLSSKNWLITYSNAVVLKPKPIPYRCAQSFHYLLSPSSSLQNPPSSIIFWLLLLWCSNRSWILPTSNSLIDLLLSPLGHSILTTCDSYSVICIVYIMGRLLMIPNNWIWLCLFVFGVLPFYIAHLGMYYGEYMRFAVISPVSEGMIVLEIICILGAIFGNSLFLKALFGVQVNFIIAVIAGIWLIFYLISNIK